MLGIKPVMHVDNEGKLVVAKADVDEDPALAQQFGIQSIPTLVLVKDGKTVDAVDLEAVVGEAFVAEHHGVVSASDAVTILEKAKSASAEAAAVAS